MQGRLRCCSVINNLASESTEHVRYSKYDDVDTCPRDFERTLVTIHHRLSPVFTIDRRYMYPAFGVDHCLKARLSFAPRISALCSEHRESPDTLSTRRAVSYFACANDHHDTKVAVLSGHSRVQSLTPLCLRLLSASLSDASSQGRGRRKIAVSSSMSCAIKSYVRSLQREIRSHETRNRSAYDLQSASLYVIPSRNLNLCNR